MTAKNLNPLEKADIAAGMRPAPARKDTPNQNNPVLVARKKRIREKQYELEDKRIESGEYDLHEFESNWATASNARRNQATGGNY